MLCVHGAKHFWDRLGWIFDVAELIVAQPVDWPLTMRIAAKLKSTRLLLLGLYLAHDLLDAPVPETILEQARRDSNVQWLAAKVRGELAGGASPHMGVLPRAAFRFRSRDGSGRGPAHVALGHAAHRERSPKRAPAEGAQPALRARASLEIDTAVWHWSCGPAHGRISPDSCPCRRRLWITCCSSPP